MITVEDLVESDFLPGMSRHAPHRGHQAGGCPTLDFVVGLVIAYGIQQIIPLKLIGIYDAFDQSNVLTVAIALPTAMLGPAPSHALSPYVDFNLPNAYNVWVSTKRKY